MKKRDLKFNPKRRIISIEQWSLRKKSGCTAIPRYGGNPEHKTRPGDYNLTTPCNPRPGKTLCDGERKFLRDEASSLLQQGFERGLVSVQMRDQWPQNVWAVNKDGEVFEAQLENQATGTYHGYPMPAGDDFRSKVIDEWHKRKP